MLALVLQNASPYIVVPVEVHVPMMHVAVGETEGVAVGL